VNRVSQNIDRKIRAGSSFRGLVLPLIGAIAVLAVSGCFRRSPRGTAERYIENLQQFNYPACYGLLSTQDRTDRSLQQFLTEIPLGPEVSPIWFRPILHETHYELGGEYRNADRVTAFVPVRITTVNLPLWERTLDAEAGGDIASSQLAQRSLDIGNYPKITYDDRIFLIKDHHHWRVAAGFAGRDRLLDQQRQAKADFYEGQVDAAIARYRSVIDELGRLPGTGNPGLAARLKPELAEIEKIKAEMPATTAYFSELKLSDVAMRMAEERVPAIFGQVTNSGNRPIDQLRLAVTWYTGRGKTLKVAHREEHPIVLTPLEFTDFSRRVVPFVHGETRPFGFLLSAPPDVQQSGAPYVTVGGIGFTQIPAPMPAHFRSTAPHSGATTAASSPPAGMDTPAGVSSPATARPGAAAPAPGQ
jgi:hypothetical protein